MTLKDLVPPLELCKRIPKGAFDDTALVWEGEGTAVWRRDGKCYAHQLQCGTVMFPAPTLAEIMCEIAKYPHHYNNAGMEVDGDGLIASAWLPNRGKPGTHLTEYRDKNAATAALKLWLELK